MMSDYPNTSLWFSLTIRTLLDMVWCRFVFRTLSQKTSKIELFAIIFNYWKQLITFARNVIWWCEKAPYQLFRLQLLQTKVLVLKSFLHLVLTSLQHCWKISRPYLVVVLNDWTSTKKLCFSDQILIKLKLL